MSDDICGDCWDLKDELYYYKDETETLRERVDILETLVDEQTAFLESVRTKLYQGRGVTCFDIDRFLNKGGTSSKENEKNEEEFELALDQMSASPQPGSGPPQSEEDHPDLEKYTTGAGQHLVVHKKGNCRGEYCPIHNPSMDWPTLWRSDWGGFMEYICPCGVGYPAPEDESAAGHVFGTCGNTTCMEEYQAACEKVKESKRG